MTGSMIIEGRRVGKTIVLFIREQVIDGEVVDQHADAGVPIDSNLYLDATDRLNTIKAQPTVYEGEVKFLSEWLRLAYEELNAAAH